jgi:enoyl-[acyl-carrier protein] reductase II
MGADGVNMGTRFLATQECPVHQAAKDRLVNSLETDTVLVMQTIGNPSRALRTSWTEKILEMERQGATLQDLIPFISGQAGVRGWQAGNLEEGILPVGQVVGRIHDVPTVADLVRRILDEAAEAKARLDRSM